MMVFVALAVALAALALALYRRVSARLDAVSRALVRIENAIGAEEWLDMLEEAAGTRFERMERDAIVSRLDRIEVAVDPMARARHEVARLMSELDDALQEDSSNAYEHWQVSKIQELVEKGERPEREAWEAWIHTPFPWS